MQDYGQLLRGICDYINGSLGEETLFLPESGDGALTGENIAGKNLPAGWITALPEKAVQHRYVDGSCRTDLPFAVFLRVNGNSPKARLDTLDKLCLVSRLLESFSPDTRGEAGFGRCRITDMPGVTTVENSGTAVYRAAYVIGCGSAGN